MIAKETITMESLIVTMNALTRRCSGGLVLAGLVMLVAPGFSSAKTFVVNNRFDGTDGVPGNGYCETTPGNRQCTLRAAIQETNALGGSNTI